MSKPSLPQGTRDFGPETLRKRYYILDTIKSVFIVYGFQPLETPAMENIDTLMGKYGDEGDKLIFKILNNGLDQPNKEQQARQAFEEVLKGRNSRGLTERALRYDLTIPFARYVSMNIASLTLPFKRYQAQPVWRADRPQKGRYREFYQCDADIVGSQSLWNEVELLHIYQKVFDRLSLKGYELRINSRKLLAALAAGCGCSEQLVPLTMAIDKLDKIGLEKVLEELSTRGFSADQCAHIKRYLEISGSNEEKLDKLQQLIGESDEAVKGLEEIRFVLNSFSGQPDSATGNRLIVDLTLARGLNYYTGLIIEAKAPASVSIGSIGGGGRYDDLTGQFGVPGIAGVGISFGIDRIYDVLEELKLFPEEIHSGTTALFFNLGEAESRTAFNAMQKLRARDIPCELYHEQAKFDKQFKYAQRKQIPYVVIIGTRELENGTAVIKNLASGTQVEVSVEQLADQFG